MNGRLGFTSLEEVLRALNAERRTGELTVSHPHGPARVWLQGGEPVHAEFRTLSGTAALNALLSDQNGDYSFEAGQPGRRRSMRRPLDNLLADALLLTSERPGLQESYIGSAVPVLSIAAGTGGKLRLSPAEIDVLRFVDGQRTVTQIAEAAGLDEYLLPELLGGLRRRGLLDIMNRRPRTARLVCRLGGRGLSVSEAGVDDGIVRSWTRALGRSPGQVACLSEDGRTFVLRLKPQEAAGPYISLARDNLLRCGLAVDSALLVKPVTPETPFRTVEKTA